MFWGPSLSGWPDWRYDGTILDQMLSVYNKTSYGYAKALSFVKAKYSNDISALNRAWYVLELAFFARNPTRRFIVLRRGPVTMRCLSRICVTVMQGHKLSELWSDSSSSSLSLLCSH